MSNRIENNNKIKNSIVGDNNTIKEKKNNVIVDVIIGVVITIISAYIIYKLGWN